MERVQFQQEQMLAELKDFVQKGLFTQAETKQILRRRTQFETALVRRVAKKNDYLRYAAYEMQLESLRRKRVERLQIPPGPPTISDYALVRRQFHIFERALKKFKADVGLWVEYIRVAQREGARALVGRITARALQLHPNKPALYILAASHELTHLAPSAARVLLQRGIRLNAESVEMWREYVRMEMGFVESVRRRWEVLGIAVDDNDKGKKDKGEKGGLATLEKMAVDGEDAEVADEKEGDEEEELGEEARRAVMNGAIVKEVISSAVKALPKLELFTELARLIRAYPSPPALRSALLDHLYAHLATALPSSPQAMRMHATRVLDDAPEGSEAFVDALHSANEALRAKAHQDQSGGMARMYATWVEEWCAKPIDDHLKLYLTASLAPRVPSSPSASEGAETPHPALLAAHLRLLTPRSLKTATEGPSSSASSSSASTPPPHKLRKLAKKYTGIAPRASGVWLARLDVEAVTSTGKEKEKAREKGKGEKEGDVMAVWKEARHAVGRGDGNGYEDGEEGERERVWTWGLDQPELGLSEEETVRVLEGLLKESMADASLRGIHETLLGRYVALAPPLTVESVRSIARTFFPSAKAWEGVFGRVTAAEGEAKTLSGGERSEGLHAGQEWERRIGGERGREREEVLREVYALWRVEAPVEASLRYAGWLLAHGHGVEAVGVVDWARGEGGEGEVERRWAEIVRGRDVEAEGDEAEEGEEMV